MYYTDLQSKVKELAKEIITDCSDDILMDVMEFIESTNSCVKFILYLDEEQAFLLPMESVEKYDRLFTLAQKSEDKGQRFEFYTYDLKKLESIYESALLLTYKKL